ncbi:MAG: bifunctional 4-hydroxy-2-oxoglutarate aldolase/2-dehydro-3-deoxy-phosphogluconate aldolase [Planctomycetota bacterium]|jgi:2-dehydro-3-deoxyphosphogluconate aldolase/(4S)-4-hydroxy-2-oxoglutarate aldolase|nr:bifunctional 4-hydroxy-2-oxoglutarate aldolase/2-dehydro-3-deoxy-phosphogluconate aldolase [Planctomycetota bacterium]
MNDEILRSLAEIGLIPVIKLASAEQALPLGKALLAGALPVAEITFRSLAAEGGIRLMARELPGLCLGAGTVLTTTQVDTAVAAGASFIVTPGFNPRVVSYCLDKGVPVTPGVNSPSLVEQAMEMGLEVLKFFPAEDSGGVKMINALSGPYGDKVAFIPSGGINAQNLVSYLSCPNVWAVGGSWMVSEAAMNAGDYDSIEKMCREARILSLGFNLLHVGINPDVTDEPMENVRMLATLLGMPITETTGAAFVGKGFEILKHQGMGEHGHLAIETLSIKRAVNWLSGFGIKPVADTLVMKGGRAALVYLDRPFMGFALHLTRRP